MKNVFICVLAVTILNLKVKNRLFKGEGHQIYNFIGQIRI